jgi:hypothetical protein
MLRALSLKNKIYFITLSVLWTSAFTYWVYTGFVWDRQHEAMGEQYGGPEAYYP